MTNSPRKALGIGGIILLVAGLLFAAQGSGSLPYPASSFMVGNADWINYGLAIAIAGLVAIYLSRRL